MRTLTILIVGLLAIGCGKTEQKGYRVGESLRDSIIGEYEYKEFDVLGMPGATYKIVLLNNGKSEWYKDGKKRTEQTWGMVNGQIHVKNGRGWTVFRIKRKWIQEAGITGSWDKSITLIAHEIHGERTDIPKEEQLTYKKNK